MAKRPGAAFTGEDEAEEGPLRSIVGGARDFAAPLISDPASRSALLQIGLNLMQPSWNSTGGAIGQAIGSGGEAVSRLEAEEMKKRKQEDELDIAQRGLDIKQQDSATYAAAQKAAGARGAIADKITLETLRQQGRAGLAGKKDLSSHAQETARVVNSPAFNEKDPTMAGLTKYKGKTSKQIQDMMEEEETARSAAPAAGVRSKDDEAREWARQNPTDPRAVEIQRRLGM